MVVVVVVVVLAFKQVTVTKKATHVSLSVTVSSSMYVAAL
jgi:hypothetical protein